jgi:two-component system response regulator HydG
MGANFSVLVVDDQPSMTATLADILEDEDYHVVIANSGEEALERCHEQQFDIVLMDVRMPGLNGIEANRLIKTFYKATSVILMSAYSIVDMKREALQDGAVAVLQKPLNIELVLRLVRERKRPPILLFIEDQEEREMLADFLENNRYRICATGTTKGALELAYQIRFKTVIFDNATASDQQVLCSAMQKISHAPACIVMDSSRARRRDPGINNYYVSSNPLELEELVKTLEQIEQKQRSKLLEKSQ